MVVIEMPSLAKSQKLQEHVWEWGLSSSSGNVSQSGGQSHRSLPQRPATWKWIFVMAVPPIYMDKSTAGYHEDFEDADRELQDLVRLEAQWTSSFVSVNC